MRQPPSIDAEEERLAQLHALGILDTPAEERFDRITRLAARLLGVPAAMVALVDRDRLWYKSRFGTEEVGLARDVSFCGHAIQSREALVVSDALADERFAANPLVIGDPGIRFYAGRPLASPDGELVGTLCIIDHIPRQLSEDDRQTFEDLGAMVENELTNLDLVRAMAAQRQAEGRLRTILNAAPLGICLVDMDEVIRDCNPAYEHLLGFEPGTLVGHRTSEFTHPDDLERSRAMYQSLAEGSVSGSLEKRYLRPDGTEFWVELTAAMVEEGPARDRYFVVMVEDITEQRLSTERLQTAYEEQAAANARLDQLNSAKSHFVSLVSHEFRTALTGIQGFSEMLRDEDLSSEEAREYGAEINADALRLNRMITEMLDLDRMESGRMTLRLTTVDLNALLRAEAVRVPAVAGRAELSLGPEVPPLEADGDKLVQVVANLLSNAVKYSPAGGPIGIRSWLEEGLVRVAVTDTGVGIPPDHLEKVFDRYTRIESESHRGIAGTGLGLPIVKQIIELHGGRVWATSREGQGTSIELSLPIHAIEADEASGGS